MKLLLVLIEGQLYLAGILAIFVAELALLCWGLWSRPADRRPRGRIRRGALDAEHAERAPGVLRQNRTARGSAAEPNPTVARFTT